MENKKRGLFRFINLFDIVVLALAGVLLAVLLLVGRGTGAVDASPSATFTCRYTIELTHMENGTAELVAPGDTLMDKVKKYNMGTVISVEVGPTLEQVTDAETGRKVIAQVPDAATATIVLEAAATESETQILVDGGFLVRRGLSVSVNGPGFWGSGYIIGVERTDDR